MDAGSRAARVSHNTVYKWREHDEEFTLAEQQAKNAFADQLEEEAVRRAWRGWLKPVYQNGSRVGTVREYSDLLLIFVLKALRPERFRERYDITHGPSEVLLKPIAVDDLALLEPGQQP